MYKTWAEEENDDEKGKKKKDEQITEIGGLVVFYQQV